MIKNIMVDEIGMREKRSDTYESPVVPIIGMSSEINKIVNIISIAPPAVYLTA